MVKMSYSTDLFMVVHAVYLFLVVIRNLQHIVICFRRTVPQLSYDGHRGGEYQDLDPMEKAQQQNKGHPK